MTKQEIGKILQGLRQDAEMTQKEVAQKLGKTQQIIGHWETGYAQPDANTLFTLCDLYGTTVDNAFGFTKKKDKYSSLKKEIKDIIRDLEKLDVYELEQVQIFISGIMVNKKRGLQENTDTETA